MQYIAFDSHKHYTIASVEDRNEPKILHEQRIPHQRGAITQFLARYDAGSPVAVETIGNWYWIIDEIEAASMQPCLTHARKAKLMLGSINKTDKLDVRGLNRLQRNGTLPTVWIPPGELRDARDLPRTRMVLVQQRTRLKNRIQATLAKYGLAQAGFSDRFGKAAAKELRQAMDMLPPHTRFATEILLEQLAQLKEHIQAFEQRMRKELKLPTDAQYLLSLPGVGWILAVVIVLELGEVSRFAGPERLASYAGTTPRVKASGDKIRYGQLRSDVNRYLKWAFIEAANVCGILHKHYPQRHVSQLYSRLARTKGHQKAIGAVARHLAEATYWIMRKHTPYKDPAQKTILSTKT